jgi:hypothetical protein
MAGWSRDSYRSSQSGLYRSGSSYADYATAYGHAFSVSPASSKSGDVLTRDPFVGEFVPPWRNRPREGVFSPDFLDWYIGK